MLLKQYLQKYNMSVNHFSIVIDRTLNHTARYVNGGDPMPQKLAEFIEKVTEGEVTREELVMPYKYPKPVITKERLAPTKERRRKTRIAVIGLLQRAMRIEEDFDSEMTPKTYVGA